MKPIFSQIISGLGAAALVVLGYLLPIILPQDSFKPGGAIVFQRTATAILPDLIVEEIRAAQSIFTLKKYLAIASIENSSKYAINTVIQFKTNDEGDQDQFALVNYSTDYFWENQDNLKEMSKGVWNLKVVNFEPGAKINVLVASDKKVEFTNISAQNGKISLIEAGTEVRTKIEALNYYERYVGAGWVMIIIFIIILIPTIFKWRLKISLVKIE